jgi:hypothetical protein
MHVQSEKSLRDIARRTIEQRGDSDDHITDAWEIFRDEAYARYSAEDDGPQDDYATDVASLFDQVKAELAIA